MRAFAACLFAATLYVPAAASAQQEACLFGGPTGDADLACGPIYVAPAPQPFARAPERAPDRAEEAPPSAFIREGGAPAEPGRPAADYMQPAQPGLPSGYEYRPVPESVMAGPAAPAPDLTGMQPYDPDVFADTAPPAGPSPYRGPYVETAPSPAYEPAPYEDPAFAQAPVWAPGETAAPYPGEPYAEYEYEPYLGDVVPYQPEPGPDLSGMRPYQPEAYAELEPAQPAARTDGAAISCICPQREMAAPAPAPVPEPAPEPVRAESAYPPQQYAQPDYVEPQYAEPEYAQPAPRDYAQAPYPAEPYPHQYAPEPDYGPQPGELNYGDAYRDPYLGSASAPEPAPDAPAFPPASETGPGAPNYPSSVMVGDGAAPAHFVYRFETPQGPAYAYEVESPDGPAYAYHYPTERGWAQETRPMRHHTMQRAEIMPYPQPRPAPYPAPQRRMHAQPAPPPLHADWRYVDEVKLYGENYPRAVAEMRAYYYEREIVTSSRAPYHEGRARQGRMYDPRFVPPPSWRGH